ncbi:MAG: hypothetical protein EBQ79_00435, partial [Actinobacteria bacterium]|nr:hypothetical protein [Actinomycetota bacterium]
MNQVSFRSIESEALVPAQWKSLADGTLSVFNMALVGLGENYLAAYRFVSGIDLKRRIATCILDKDLNVVPGSAQPFSDHLSFASEDISEQSKDWFADPRLFSLRGDTYMIWNNGHTANEPNQQFLVKVS